MISGLERAGNMLDPQRKQSDPAYEPSQNEVPPNLTNTVIPRGPMYLYIVERKVSIAGTTIRAWDSRNSTCGFDPSVHSQT